MSKYEILWEYIVQSNCDSLRLSLEEAGAAAGVPIDHSFLRFKKELTEYGYRVGKISTKEQYILFERLDEKERGK